MGIATYNNPDMDEGQDPRAVPGQYTRRPLMTPTTPSAMSRHMAVEQPAANRARGGFDTLYNDSWHIRQAANHSRIYIYPGYATLCPPSEGMSYGGQVSLPNALPRDNIAGPLVQAVSPDADIYANGPVRLGQYPLSRPGVPIFSRVPLGGAICAH